MEPLLYLALGLGVGLVIGWLLGQRRASHAADSPLLLELRQQLARREAELDQWREQLRQAAAAKAAAESTAQSLEKNLLELKQQRQDAETAAADWRDKHAQTHATLATATADLRAARELLEQERNLHQKALQELRAQHDKALLDLSDKFKALSLDALKSTHPEFLRLATETLKGFQSAAQGDLDQRKEAIAGLLKPLQETLRQYQDRLQQTENQQSSMLGEVKKQLESLSQQSAALAAETLQFRMVLKSSQARGQWGEATLRRVVETAGMSAHCDFDVQLGAEGQRPDLVIHLPENRKIIVDAKVPDLDFLNALDDADPARRAQALAAHAAKLKGTIRELAQRNYPKLFDQALDYVVLFLPAESLFSAALEGDRDLLVWAASQRILLATPASLIALLRSVSISWQYYTQNQNAQQIVRQAGDLYDRVVVFIGHFQDIGRHLDRAAESYNRAVRSYESRLRIQGERLRELGGGDPQKPMPEIKAIEHVVEQPDAPAET